MVTYDEVSQYFEGRRVLVTGHTGFKGGWLALWLSLMGAEVIGFALEPVTVPNLFGVVEIEKYLYRSVIGDILDRVLVEEVISEYEPEIVFHLAAQPIVKYSYDDPVYTFEVNVMGTVNLLDAVRNTASVRVVVNVTTDKVYENREWVWGYREIDSLGGYDPYSSSKACSEIVTSSYVNSFFRERGIGIATARAGNVIGGGDWAPFRLIPDIVRALSQQQKVILRKPNAVRPWQHVLEPLWGYILLAYRLSNDISFSGAWNFGPRQDDVLRVIDVVKIALNAWGSGEYEIRSSDFHETMILRLDVSKAMTLLGWKPVWSAEDAIKRTIAWYKAFYNGNMDMYRFTIAQINEYIDTGLR